VPAILQQRRIWEGLKAAHLEKVDQVVDGLAGRVVEGNAAGLMTFAGGSRQVQLVAGGLVVDMADVKTNHFADAQASLGEETNERVIFN